jgi:hypothetical protein
MVRHGIIQVSKTEARNLLDEAGLVEQPLPRMGYLVPLDEDMNRWIENCSGRFSLVVWADLLKPAWLDPVIPTRDIGKYLRRQGRYRDW